MEQVLIAGAYNLLNTTTTEYSLVCGRFSWNADVDIRAEAVSTPGKLKNLRVELNDVPGTGTYTFTLHRAVGTGAWANTALTCTVAADGTTASDMVNEVAVAAGDVIALECNPDSPDNARYAKWTMMFEGDNANESLLLIRASPSTAATQYFRPMGGATLATENDVRCVCPTSGKIKNLYVQLSVDPGTAPDALRFTLRIGGANSDDGEGNPLQVTITADDRTGNDTTHEITVSAGDVLTVMVEPLNSPTRAGIAAVGMTFVADTDGESLILGGAEDDLSNSATEYHHLISTQTITWTGTEAERYQLAQECTLKKLYALLSGSPGAGNKYTLTVRQNAASPGSGLVVEIADAATTGNDTTNTITLANDDELDMMCVPDSTPTARDAYWGLVGFIVVGQALTKSLSDTVAISDSISKAFGMAQSDSVAMTDSFSKVSEFYKSFSDSVNISDSIVCVRGLYKTLTDAMAISDSISCVRGLYKTLADSIAITDSIQLIKNYIKLHLTKRVFALHLRKRIFSLHLKKRDFDL